MGTAAAQTKAPRLGLVIVAMTIGNAIILVSQTAVPLALPSIMHELGVGSAAVQWVLTASLLPLAGLMVLGGRLGDMFGLRRMFLLGAIVFAAASALAGIAPSFEVLVAARAVQGVGGALLLPTSVAIVSSAASAKDAGRALGTLGGAAAVAGALGPIIGGALTGLVGWRGVMLINLPLAALAIAVTLVVVPRDGRAQRAKVDMVGAVLLCVLLVGVVFGIGQSQTWGWSSPGVWGPLVLGIAAGVVFTVVERRIENPLLDLGLLRRHRNYAGATISQGLGGMIEMGLGIIFPLMLILNLGMDPTLAGLALLPTTLPMVVVAPLVGRWYDRVGGRVPLVVGFAILALSGLSLLLASWTQTFPALIPGLLLYGIGLAIVLTANDPVSLDSVPAPQHGQVSGVSATAEQFGGALGIAVFYLAMHATYIHQLNASIDASSLADLTPAQGKALRDGLEAAEQTGLNPQHFDPAVREYLVYAFDASALGYAVAFGCTALVAILGAIASWILVRKPAVPRVDLSGPGTVFAASAVLGSGTAAAAQRAVVEGTRGTADESGGSEPGTDPPPTAR